MGPSTMNVNLARRDDVVTLGQPQERSVAEGSELTVVIPTLSEPRQSLQGLRESQDDPPAVSRP
jgi:hypothetical protein